MPVALVTGGGRGIGAACAVTLAEAGYDVGIGYAGDRDAAEATAKRVTATGRRAHVHAADVADPDAAAGLVAAVEDDLGPLDALILNAGITRDGPALRMDPADWDAVIQTNLSGAFYTARPALRGMLKRRAGAVVALSSVVGMTGNPGQVNYAASKAGLLGMVKTLARESAARGVRVNAVAPGYIATDMTAAIPEQYREKILAATPLGRLGEPADVAAAVRFLCSDDAAFMTGTVMSVDGGLAIGA